MSKDDFDIFRHLKTPKSSSALNLFNALNDRQLGGKGQNDKSQQSMHLYAEEQLVRKEPLKEMRCQIPGLPRATFLMVFSSDGQRVASTHGNHNIYVTDLKSGKNIKTLIGHPRTPWCIAFHPTSDQIVASGCLGGQVRIWDLSGGSEVWTTTTQTVIASIAFHPNDRILVIATFNEIYFWDWSQREPFTHISTNHNKEKIRYVAFDKLGHKLITGIANSPQTRWERVRAPVPVPRQERAASPYRRRITQRLVTTRDTPLGESFDVYEAPSTFNQLRSNEDRNSSIPDRERRITMCYRNLVREYELLVHRYLQLYRPPTMIDRGTDPMEPSHFNSGTQTSSNSTGNDPSLPGPSGVQASTSTNAPTTTSSNADEAAGPSTSVSQDLIHPFRILKVIDYAYTPSSSIRGTQTAESRKHKSESGELNKSNEKRLKRNEGEQHSDSSSSSESAPAGPSSETNNCSATPNQDNNDDQKVLVVNLERLPSTSTDPTNSNNSPTNNNVEEPRSLVVNLETLPSCSVTEGRKYYAKCVSNILGKSKRKPSSVTRPEIASCSRSFPNVRIPESVGSSQGGFTERFNQYILENRLRIQQFRNRFQTDGAQRNPEGEENNAAQTNAVNLSRQEVPQAREATSNSRNDELLSNIRRTAEEQVRSRILPIIRSIPPNDRPELIRLFENSREHVRMRFRQMCPLFLRRHCRRPWRIDSSTDSSSSDNDGNRNLSIRMPNNTSQTDRGFTPRTERNFNTELEQLVTSLLSEIEWPDESGANNTNASALNLTADNEDANLHVAETTFEEVPAATRRPSRIFVHSLASATDHEAIWNVSEIIRTPHGLTDANSSSINPIDLSLNERSATADEEPLQQSARTQPRIPSPPGARIEDLLDRPLRREVTFRRYSQSGPCTSSTLPSNNTLSNSTPNIDTRTTNSTSYTSSNMSPTTRRRFFSHRVSAFMPTRVNYTRMRFIRNPYYTWGSGRAGIPRSSRTPSLILDDLINYATRSNSTEDDTSNNYQAIDLSNEIMQESPGITTMYANIVQSLESSLNDVRNIRASNRIGETSDMLNSFSQRLDNIMSQSDQVLRNLRSSIDVLPNPAERNPLLEYEPRLTFNDPTFYVRDLRSENSDINPEPSESNFDHLIDSLHAVSSDHTYPRNPTLPGRRESLIALMRSLHLTLSHIQRQATLLRRQVESIERIDRAMAEVSQLQLIRQLFIQMVRHIQSLAGASRTAGVSSVRQMMAGTRISDSNSPQDSANDEPGPSGSITRHSTNPSTTSSISTPSCCNDQPGPSSGNSSNQPRRSTHRKTYPPSRFLRCSRHYHKRPALLQLFTRRMNRFVRHSHSHSHLHSPRTPQQNRPPACVPNNSPQVFNYSNINSATLNLMTRRLEQLLTSQMRAVTRPQNPGSSITYSPCLDLGERILGLRLQGCFTRMNRVLGNRIDSNSFRNLRSDAASNTATQDGASRYEMRQQLSSIVDGMSRYIEEHGSGTNNMRIQIQAVLTMSLLLTELLLLRVADSIPPPAEVNLNVERDSLGRRIDEIFRQMLQNRGGGSMHITRSLTLMRSTMRHARRALDQTYTTRRNAILPSQETDRRQLLGTVNRCLRTIGRANPERNSPSSISDNSNQRLLSSSTANTNANSPYNESFFNTINELINRYSDNRNDEHLEEPSCSRNRPFNNSLSSNDNSDDDEDEAVEPTLQTSANLNPVNAQDRGNSSTSENQNAQQQQQSSSGLNNSASASAAAAPQNNPQERVWTVPSVQVNDVPVSEPSLAYAHRFIAHRQRVADRILDIRSNSRPGLFRQRFLHPLYASVNPFDADLDDPHDQREIAYDSDLVTTMTPNHRIQAWDISNWDIPCISNPLKNIVVSECKIHNDASVDIATDGTILVTLLPSGGYLNVTNRLGVYSLRWETLGQCLYTTSFEQNAVSVSLSPLSRHLVVGFATRRVSILPNDHWIMARIYKIEQKDVPGDRLPVLKELEHNRDSRINCIKWLPTSGQGLIYATNTGKLVILS